MKEIDDEIFDSGWWKQEKMRKDVYLNIYEHVCGRVCVCGGAREGVCVWLNMKDLIVYISTTSYYLYGYGYIKIINTSK